MDSTTDDLNMRDYIKALEAVAENAEKLVQAVTGGYSGATKDAAQWTQESLDKLAEAKAQAEAPHFDDGAEDDH